MRSREQIFADVENVTGGYGDDVIWRTVVRLQTEVMLDCRDLLGSIAADAQLLVVLQKFRMESP